MRKNLPKIVTLVFLVIFIFQMIGLIVLLLSPTSTQAISFKPQTGIGTEIQEGRDMTVDETSIGKYISAIYKYGIGVVGIIAAVVLMFGGVVWLTAGGNQTRIGEAKAWIGASLSGIVIALTSYMILSTVSPEAVKLRPINVPKVEGLGCCDKLKSGERGCSMVSESNCESSGWYKEGWSCTDSTDNGVCTNLPTTGPSGTVYKWKCLPRFTPCEDGTEPPSITYERSTCESKLGSATECTDSQYPQSICCGL